jgi:hypothetical protein
MQLEEEEAVVVAMEEEVSEAEDMTLASYLW